VYQGVAFVDFCFLDDGNGIDTLLVGVGDVDVDVSDMTMLCGLHLVVDDVCCCTLLLLLLWLIM
jgi:hypothetical protein